MRVFSDEAIRQTEIRLAKETGRKCKITCSKEELVEEDGSMNVSVSFKVHYLPLRAFEEQAVELPYKGATYEFNGRWYR